MSSPRCFTPLRAAGVAILAATAGAQPAPPPRDEPRVTISAEFGWGGRALPADRFAPVRVRLQGADRAVGGVLVMEYQQDATQRARIATPAATTPGKITEIELIAAMPAGCDRVTFSLLSEEGRRIARETYSAFDTRRALPLPATPTSGVPIVVAAGREPPALFRPGEQTQADGESGENPWLAAMAVRHDPERLPTAWAAYEGVATLIIDAELASQIDPVALEAIRTWVLCGGRLALVADSPTQAWPRWFENPVQALPVELAEVARVRTPDSLRAVVEEADHGIPAEERAEPPMSALHARALTLTESGLADAWTLSHEVEGGGALVAQGPLGFGWVVVLGFDPHDASAAESTYTAGALWRDALAEAMGTWLARGEKNDAFPWWIGNSGGDQHECSAIESALSTVDDLSLPIDLTFTLIALGTFALAMVVGPINAIVLKRLDRRHAAWLATIGCAAVASALGWVVPGMVRTSPTSLFRTSAEDILMGPDPIAPPLTWRTITTALMTNTNGRIPLDHADPRGFWRGISPLWSGESQIGPSFETVQTGASLEGWRQRGGAPESLTQNQWSLRTSLAMEPTGLPLFATAVRDGDGWAVGITGLPGDALVTAAALEIRAGFFDLGDARREGPFWHFAGRELSDGLPEDFEWLGTEHTNPYASSAPFGQGARRLPGVWQRDAAADARIGSGRWGAIHLLVRHESPDLSLDRPGVRYRTDRAIRILVPLSPRDALDPEPTP